MADQINRVISSNDRALRIIARSLYKELKQNGYDSRQIVSVSTELLSLVTSELRNTQQDESTFSQANPTA